MKKKLLTAALVIAMVFSIIGCNRRKPVTSIIETTTNTANPQTDEEDLSYLTIDTSNKAITAEQYNSLYETTAKVYQKYIKLPTYKGLDVEFSMPKATISPQDVDNYIREILQSYATKESVTNGVTDVGDTIVLDYSGKLNGVAFTGGTAADATYTIGSGQFISDLDKGLVGLNVGTLYKIPCTYPENYDSEELRGKNVIFEVKVTAIIKTILPELTDEWVAKNAKELGTTETTVEGLIKVVTEYLEDSTTVESSSAKFEAILAKIAESIDIKEYPKKEIDSLKATWKTNVEAEYNNSVLYYYYSDFAEYKKNVYGCEDDAAFDKLATEKAQEYLLEKMIITLIAYDNEITVSADDIKELGAEYAEYYQFESYDAILKKYGNIMNAELGYGVLSEKVQEIVNGSNTATLVPEESSN